MVLEENVHYVATVTVKKVVKTTTGVHNPLTGPKQETARSITDVVSLAVENDELNDLLGLVMEHLRLHLKRT